MQKSRLTRIVAICALLSAVAPACAQTVEELWIAMPDNIVPYLNTNLRKEMIECHRIGVDTNVKNKLDGNSSIDTLTADYGRFAVSAARDLQLAKLPTAADTLLLLIDTHKAPAAQSKASVYTLQWKPATADGIMPALTTNDFVERRDTTSAEEYDELTSIAASAFREYNYDAASGKLNVTVTLPFATVEDKKRIEKSLRQQTLTWNGTAFTKDENES